MPHLPEILPREGESTVVFPPVTRDHIQNCSYDAWFPKYRSSCLKSRIIPLPPAFIAYLHEDGIILADDDEANEPEEAEWSSTAATHPRVSSYDSSDDEDEEEEEKLPPNKRFPETHELIKQKIAELGGSVAPKLNWSSPKDAKWISPHQNTLKCTTPNDIYLLLKSSSFVSHDLLHAFDDCTDTPPMRPFTPVLVLRPFFTPHVALEFRCFVKHRSLIGITQRDLNHYDFLERLQGQLWKKIRTFFRQKLRLTFPDSSFVFDIYIPGNTFAEDGLGKVRLMDINPWAPSTDSLLFAWEELLTVEVENPLYGSVSEGQGADGSEGETTGDETDDDASAEYSPDRQPEVRLVRKNDPEAYNFSSPQYSAHKLPKEVVDASLAGEGGLREFAQRWKEITEGRGQGIWEQPSNLNAST